MNRDKQLIHLFGWIQSIQHCPTRHTCLWIWETGIWNMVQLWDHRKSCSQQLDVQVKTSDKWHSSGVGIGSTFFWHLCWWHGQWDWVPQQVCQWHQDVWCHWYAGMPYRGTFTVLRSTTMRIWSSTSPSAKTSTKIIRGLKYLSYEDRLWEFVLFSLEKELSLEIS